MICDSLDGPGRRWRVIHLTSVPESLNFLSEQPKFFRENGFDFQVVSSAGPALDAFARSQQVPAFSVEIGRTFSALRDLRSILRLFGLFRRLSPDIVHAHTPKAGLLAMCAAFLAGVPVRIFHIHGLPHLTATGSRRLILVFTTWLACRLATRVLAVSHTNKDVAIKDCSCPPDKIRVLANGTINGVDTHSRFDPSRQGREARLVFRDRHRIPAEAFVAAFIGRMARDKGLTELADAWRQIAAEHPEAVLVIAGGADARDPLSPVVARKLLGLPSVRYAGWINNTPELYGSIDLLVLPSYREGFSLVLLEAAAMALPVVASDVTGCRDAVVSGQTGILVPVHDPQALARAIDCYARNPWLRRLHGEAARARAVADFQPSEVWKATLKAYREQIREHPRRAGRGYRWFKRLLDVTVALLGLLLLAPLMAALALLIRQTMQEPALFRQVRPGFRERPFTMFKFRTMRTLHRRDGRAAPDAERLTWLGRILRKTSLDELPELWNVLKGEMTLVGPRPLRTDYLPYFEESERLRFLAVPGITGWAQVHGRNRSPWDERLANDIWYVRNCSLALDLRILAMTVLQVLRPGDVIEDARSAMLNFDEERRNRAAREVGI